MSRISCEVKLDFSTRLEALVDVEMVEVLVVEVVVVVVDESETMILELFTVAVVEALFETIFVSQNKPVKA